MRVVLQKSPFLIYSAESPNIIEMYINIELRLFTLWDLASKYNKFDTTRKVRQMLFPVVRNSTNSQHWMVLILPYRVTYFTWGDISTPRETLYNPQTGKI
jgi:hypothetical protein